jgi:trans-feruloyl-CoA hydratase/vanillin synthase
MSEYEDLLVDAEAGVATVTLNRPEKRNAMSRAIIREMPRVLEDLRYRADVKVLVITGAGDAFCAGADLKEFFHDLRADGRPPDEFERYFRWVTEWRARTLYYYPKPTIAMVNGWCFGGAFPIIEGCDLAIAAEDAQFGLSEVNWGVFPGGTAGKSTSRVLRPKDAMWYGLTGEMFDGKRAAEINFVNIAVPRSQLRERTMQVARSLALKDPHALRATKNVLRMSLEMTWEAAVDYAWAKEKELTLNQKGAWIDRNIPEFLDGRYKPGLGGREEQLASTDQAASVTSTR